MIKSETATNPRELTHPSYIEAEGENVLKIPERFPKIGVVSTNSTQAGSDVQPRSSSTQLSTDIVNHSGKVIYVKLQNNIPLAIEPVPNHQLIHPFDEAVIFRMNIRIITRSSATETANYLSQIKNNGLPMSPQAQEMLSALEAYVNRAPRLRGGDVHFNFCLESKIPMAMLADSNFVRHQETDIIVAKRKEDLLRPHPSSPAGLQLDDLYSNPETTEHAGLFIRIVDNNQLCPSRFFFSGKQLIEVPCRLDQTKADGVYAIILTKENHGLRTRSEFMTFEEAEKEFGLYRTREEALTGGDPTRFIDLEESKSKEREKELARELADLKHRTELERQKAEMERQKTDMEKYSSEMAKIRDEQELQRLRLQNQQLKEDSERISRYRDDFYNDQKLHREEEFANRKYARDDNYDERSTTRKEQEGKSKFKLEKYKSKKEKQSAGMKFAAEAMKLAPVIVLGGIALYGMLNRDKGNGFVYEH